MWVTTGPLASFPGSPVLECELAIVKVGRPWHQRHVKGCAWAYPGWQESSLSHKWSNIVNQKVTKSQRCLVYRVTLRNELCAVLRLQCLAMQLIVSHCFLDMNHGHKNDSVTYFVKLILNSATQINILCPLVSVSSLICSLFLLFPSLQSTPIDCQLPGLQSTPWSAVYSHWLSAP